MQLSRASLRGCVATSTCRGCGTPTSHGNAGLHRGQRVCAGCVRSCCAARLHAAKTQRGLRCRSIQLCSAMCSIEALTCCPLLRTGAGLSYVACRCGASECRAHYFVHMQHVLRECALLWVHQETPLAHTTLHQLLTGNRTSGQQRSPVPRLSCDHAERFDNLARMQFTGQLDAAPTAR